MSVSGSLNMYICIYVCTCFIYLFVHSRIYGWPPMIYTMAGVSRSLANPHALLSTELGPRTTFSTCPRDNALRACACGSLRMRGPRRRHKDKELTAWFQGPIQGGYQKSYFIKSSCLYTILYTVLYHTKLNHTIRCHTILYTILGSLCFCGLLGPYVKPKEWYCAQPRIFPCKQ